ncbi:MAG: iron uptake porin [Cyanobacteria bacterium P01_A01_bin.83]
MFKIKQPALLGTAALLYAAIFSGSSVSAQEVDTSNPNEIADYANFNDEFGEADLDMEQAPADAMGQVTNVNQLRDVSPADWAYEALRSLVDRYGCIAGFPNQTYRGNQPMTRYEFAAGLNSCLNQIERLIAANSGPDPEDLALIERMTQEFEAELAAVGGRVDELESRTAVLEDNQFSTTTKLVGEVTFNLSQSFGDEQALNPDDNPDLDSEVRFADRIRLMLVSSFTGKDKLFTRITAGNTQNSFQDETGTREGRFAFDGFADNDIILDRLHYSFPAFNDKLRVTSMVSLAAHHFYANTFNPGLEAGGGANGGLTRFSERNPIYRQGLANSSAGIGASFEVNDFITLTGGYVAPNAFDPSEGAGLFDGSFSALGQIEVTPIEPLQIGLTYVRGYDNEQTLGDLSPRGTFLFGNTGTNFANFEDEFGNTTISGSAVETDSFGLQFLYDVTDKISIRGWGSFTDADIVQDGGDGDGDILNYAAAFVVTDIIKEGSLAALIVGAEPYLTSIDADGDGDDEAISNDVPIHVETFYKYQFNDNISITPGFIWLPTPNQDGNNDDIFIGSLRTTFTF